MYKRAISHGVDTVPIGLAANIVPDQENEDGKARKWTAVFARPSLRRMTRYTYTTAQGVAEGASWAAEDRPASKPFSVDQFVIDSDKALSAARGTAAEFLKKKPNLAQLFLSSQDGSNRPVWSISWGGQVDGYLALVDAATGAVEHVPNLAEVSRELSRGIGRCAPVGQYNVSLIGSAFIWDDTKGVVDRVAVERIPQDLRTSDISQPLTVFAEHNRDQIQVGTYQISGEPAYRETMEVTVFYWPSKQCVGNVTIQGGDPPKSRPVVHEPGYGSSVGLAEWITSLGRSRELQWHGR